MSGDLKDRMGVVEARLEKHINVEHKLLDSKFKDVVYQLKANQTLLNDAQSLRPIINSLEKQVAVLDVGFNLLTKTIGELKVDMKQDNKELKLSLKSLVEYNNNAEDKVILEEKSKRRELITLFFKIIGISITLGTIIGGSIWTAFTRMDTLKLDSEKELKKELASKKEVEKIQEDLCEIKEMLE